MKAPLIMAMMAAFISMGSACTKSCKGQSTVPEKPAQEKQVPQAPKAEAEGGGEQAMEAKFKDLKPGDKLYAIFDTSMGPMKAELFWEKAPNTVRNFVELAEGTKEWQHPGTQEKSHKPLYNGTIFHRIINGFMIQGGDPIGKGIGGPGYKFKDEFHPDLKHDKIGVLSMANAGPNTNGSQFFITLAPTPHLDNRHSVFGQVTDAESLKVLQAIGSVETAHQDKPKTDVVLKAVRIEK